MSFFAELKRRKVFRVAAAYAVAAWGVAQIADLVLANTAAPPWVMQVILLLLALGFPIAVILAWAFEVTPDGVKRTERAENSEATAKLPTGDYVLIALLLAVIGVAGFQIALMSDQNASDRATTVSDASGSASQATAENDHSSGSTSIAVLAFENMSPDPDNAYFAEGISEEILNVLASVEDLKVASRTSAFSFTGTQTPIPDIARQLGVVHVLEGSVRKAGNRVRITAQLIDARNDQHLWSDAYDRSLDDIFAVQEEIAQAIAGALTDRLGVDTIQVQAPTDNLEAYEAMLRGRQRFHQRGDTIDQSIADLERAVALDPDFGLAWALLSAAYYVAPGYPTELEFTDALSNAERALQRALALAPDQPLALAVKGQILIDRGEWITGLEALQRAADLTENDTTPQLWLGLNMFAAGYAAEARKMIDAAWTSDPLVGITNGYRGIIRYALGEEDVDRFIEFAARNGWEHGYSILAGDAILAGDLPSAVESLEALQRHAPEANRIPEPIYQTLIESLRAGRIPDIDRARIETLPYPAFIDLLLGNAEAFFSRLLELPEDSYRFNRATWLRQVWQPNSEIFREHPLFFEYARRAGLVELWQSRGYPPGCAPVDGPDDRHLSCPEFPQ